MPSNERSAEYWRGVLYGYHGSEYLRYADIHERIAAAEVREAGERIGESLLVRLRQDLTAIRYHLGGVGPEIKLALDDSSRQSNILVAIHALDALLPLLTKAREATQPTAAEVIEAAEKFARDARLNLHAIRIADAVLPANATLEQHYSFTNKADALEVEEALMYLDELLSIVARWKEANGA